ncbi:peroxiredoxin [Acinetobacter boissieri]|uniref:thioredoxin-dependent peroxiredoxin n=1 Tax=Acinetobacter boissieri TaxID=1219383 RepID=A0A1G6HA08_9GAMM|nr:redoxin domain-containing protein [Acinetobacter boissieri]SDB91102.1 peroxiredoxin Q/BCP [Acinetobacter boissieri]
MRFYSLFFIIILANIFPSLHASNDFKNTSSATWVGKTAPDFQLFDQKGKSHTLSQYQGKWVVLYFYPKDNSPGCTEEANQFKALYPKFLQQHAVILGVSLDNIASHQHFSDKLQLPFPILADSKQTLAQSFGLIRDFGIIQFAKRETFLIDPQGNITYHYQSVNTQTHASKVLADITKANSSH